MHTSELTEIQEAVANTGASGPQLPSSFRRIERRPTMKEPEAFEDRSRGEDSLSTAKTRKVRASEDSAPSTLDRSREEELFAKIRTRRGSEDSFVTSSSSPEDSKYAIKIPQSVLNRQQFLKVLYIVTLYSNYTWRRLLRIFDREMLRQEKEQFMLGAHSPGQVGKQRMNKGSWVGFSGKAQIRERSLIVTLCIRNMLGQ